MAMATPSKVPAPAGSVPADEFYSQDERRATSHDLSYGSGWKRDGWSDESHVVELYWLRATHELAVFYVAYDWSRVDPSEMKVSMGEAVGEEAGGGVELGQSLRLQDEATAEVYVEVLGHLESNLQRHEVMRGWHLLQHHPDGLDHIRRRIARHAPGEGGS